MLFLAFYCDLFILQGLALFYKTTLVRIAQTPCKTAAGYAILKLFRPHGGAYSFAK